VTGLVADLWDRITAAIGTATDPGTLPYVVAFTAVAALVIVWRGPRRG